MDFIQRDDLLGDKFKNRYRDIDGIFYGSSKVFVGREFGEDVSTIRVALRDDPKRKHGLISDLSIFVQDTRNIGKQTIKFAEDHLIEQKVERINAIVMEGKKLSYLFYDLGFWPSRKSVVIAWDLSIVPREPDKTSKEYSFEFVHSKDFTDEFIENISKFVFNSYQPYWRWWKEHKEVFRWWRTEYDDSVIPKLEDDVVPEMIQRIKEYFKSLKGKDSCVIMGFVNGELNGICDAIADTDEENIVIGVATSKDFKGKQFGSNILLRALNFLREKGLENVYTITTSGLDDYDPTVYLYTFSGKGQIIYEYNILVKKIKTYYQEEKIFDIGQPLEI